MPGLLQAANIIVAEFPSKDDLDISKPDHDPHGEPQALAARSGYSCDGDDCETRGLVPTAKLDLAHGHVDGRERDVLCKECVADVAGLDL